MSKSVKEFFNSIANNYIHEDNERIDDLLYSLNIKEGMRILDLGTGKGIISHRLFNLAHKEVIGLDISEKMIEIAKANNSNPNIKYVVDDFYNYQSEPFDMIVCFDAFPHFLDVDGFVNKAYSLLKDNGVLAIIHDCGREELNNHHQAHAQGVSRYLSDPEKEVRPFLNKFSIVSIDEGPDFYKIIVKK